MQQTGEFPSISTLVAQIAITGDLRNHTAIASTDAVLRSLGQIGYSKEASLDTIQRATRLGFIKSEADTITAGP